MKSRFNSCIIFSILMLTLTLNSCLFFPLSTGYHNTYKNITNIHSNIKLSISATQRTKILTVSGVEKNDSVNIVLNERWNKKLYIDQNLNLDSGRVFILRINDFNYHKKFDTITIDINNKQKFKFLRIE